MIFFEKYNIYVFLLELYMYYIYENEVSYFIKIIE